MDRQTNRKIIYEYKITPLDYHNCGVGDNGNANHVFGWFHAAKEKLINHARNNVVGSKVITVL